MTALGVAARWTTATLEFARSAGTPASRLLLDAALTDGT